MDNPFSEVEISEEELVEAKEVATEVIRKSTDFKQLEKWFLEDQKIAAIKSSLDASIADFVTEIGPGTSNILDNSTVRMPSSALDYAGTAAAKLTIANFLANSLCLTKLILVDIQITALVRAMRDFWFVFVDNHWGDSKNPPVTQTEKYIEGMMFEINKMRGNIQGLSAAYKERIQQLNNVSMILHSLERGGQ